MCTVTRWMWLCCIVLIFGNQPIKALTEYDVDGYCTLVPDGTKLPSIVSCHHYYRCTNGKGVKGDCLTNVFDRNSQGCIASTTSKCGSSIVESCDGVIEGFRPIADSCSGYIYCENGVEIGRSNCPNGLTFHDGACDYTKCSDSETSSIVSSCDIVPDGVFFGSTMSCSTWQLCSAGQHFHDDCSPTTSSLVFNIQGQRCDYKSAGDFCSHVTYQQLQPNEEIPPKQCSEEGSVEPHVDICSAYFKCTNGKALRNDCSKGNFFDIHQTKCKSRQTAQPIDTCDRCEGTNNQFVNAVDENCETYLVCQDGKTSSKNTCPKNFYFNEDWEACMAIDGVENYASTHGACKTDSVSNTTKAPTGAPTSASTPAPAPAPAEPESDEE